MKANYHTHTSRCQHAVGTDEEYVQAGIKAGFDLLGISDHAPWPFATGFVSKIRMPIESLQEYIRSVQQLQTKYSGQIDLRLGMEAEYFPRYRDHMLRMRDMGVSYYILGQHYADSEEENPYVGLECQDDDGVRRYAESCVQAMRTGLFCYIAHPDLMMRHRTEEQFNDACREAADMICQTALEMKLPIEYNLLGLDYQLKNKSRGYPCRAFWEYVRKWNNPVILGVDAHDPAMLADCDLWANGQQRVCDLGFRLISDLESPVEEKEGDSDE